MSDQKYEVVECRKCGGKGFTEEEGGVIMIDCDKCAGKGKVKRRLKV